MTLIFDLRTSKCIQLFYLSLSIDRLNLKLIGQKTPEKSCNASRTDFQRLSPRDLDLWPMALQMQMNTTFANVYTPSRSDEKWQRNRNFRFFYFVSLWPWPLTFASQNLYISSTSHYLSSGKLWEILDDKWQRNLVTQASVKKKKKMIKKNKIKDKTKTERSADYVRQTLQMAGNSNHKY